MLGLIKTEPSSLPTVLISSNTRKNVQQMEATELHSQASCCWRPWLDAPTAGLPVLALL